MPDPAPCMMTEWPIMGWPSRPLQPEKPSRPMTLTSTDSPPWVRASMETRPETGK